LSKFCGVFCGFSQANMVVVGSQSSGSCMILLFKNMG
jgi:hypothetical protein